jgi:hypothetical protein
MRFGRTLCLFLLAGMPLTAVTTGNNATAAVFSCRQHVGDACDCAGRMLGIGWGDGYHASKRSVGQLGLDFPLLSYAAKKGYQVSLWTKTCQQKASCSRLYDYFDYFDAECGGNCGGGCEGCEGSWQGSDAALADMQPIEMQPQQPQPSIGEKTVPSLGSPSLQSVAAAMQQSPASVFRRFAATDTPLATVPVHPSQPPVSRAGIRLEQNSLGQVYPTLIAPPRARNPELNQDRGTPALRRLDRTSSPRFGVSSQTTGAKVPKSLRTYSTLDEVNVSTAMGAKVPESPRTYSTLDEINVRKAMGAKVPESPRTYSTLDEINVRKAMGAKVPKSPRTYSTLDEINVRKAIENQTRVSAVPTWVMETADESPGQRSGYAGQHSASSVAPVLELANRPGYSVDNVIRQPDIQR